MLSRLIPKASQFRYLSRISSNSPSFPHSHFGSSPQSPLTSLLRHFSSNQNNNGNGPPLFDTWNISQEGDAKFDRVFSEESGDLSGIGGTENEVGKNPVDAVDDWPTTEGYSLWSLGEEEKPETEVFDLAVDAQAAGDALSGGVEIEPADAQAAGDALSGGVENEPAESVRSAKEEMMLQMEEEKLTEVLKGPNRAFGDLIAVSGITDDMLDSLIALKDFDGIEGLPPLREIEDERYEKSLRKNTRAEIERQKQEEIAKARVRKVDEQGRAYGTGRRKCSIARVWIQPGEGKFVINEKAFDVYFPVLDHRATLLRPFSETNTLGLWDVDCTVKGGGMSGQVGAIRLGISRALQNWEPELRPPLRSAGFLTRDSRVVERKKPGKAKARKSFQWVKR